MCGFSYWGGEDRNRWKIDLDGFSEYDPLIGAAGVRIPTGLSGSAMLAILGFDGLSFDFRMNIMSDTEQGGGGGRRKNSKKEQRRIKTLKREIYPGPRCGHEDGGD